MTHPVHSLYKHQPTCLSRYVMEPDVPGGSVHHSLLGMAHVRGDKEVTSESTCTLHMEHCTFTLYTTNCTCIGAIKVVYITVSWAGPMSGGTRRGLALAHCIWNIAPVNCIPQNCTCYCTLVSV